MFGHTRALSPQCDIIRLSKNTVPTPRSFPDERILSHRLCGVPRAGVREDERRRREWGVFTTQLSDAAGADLAAVFAAWGVPVPEAVLADCAARHPAAPESLRP